MQVVAGGGAGPDHKLPRHNIPSRRRREERPVAREEGESEVRMVKTFLRSLRQLEYQQWQEFWWSDISQEIFLEVLLEETIEIIFYYI